MVTTTGALSASAQVNEEAELLEMISKAEEAAEPGDQRGRIVSKDTEDTFASGISTVTSAGYVTIYDTKSGVSSLTNRNMLPAQLKKKYEDGTRIFTVTKPRVKLIQGTLLCYLHSDRPERAKYAAMGLPACKKSNLVASYHLDSHMKHRHKQEWTLLENERIKTLEQDERTDRRTTLDLMKHMIERDGVIVESTPEAVEAASVEKTAVVTKGSGETAEMASSKPIIEQDSSVNGASSILGGAKLVSVSCPTCSRQIKGKNITGAKAKLRSHNKRVHG